MYQPISNAARRREAVSRQARNRVINEGWPAMAIGQTKKKEIMAGNGRKLSGPVAVSRSGDCARRLAWIAGSPPARRTANPAVRRTPISMTMAWKLSVQATARKPP